MNAKIPVFVVCIEAIIYLLLFNMRDCTFKTILIAPPSFWSSNNIFLSL